MRNGWKPKDMTLRFTCPLLPDASASFALHFMPYTNTTTITPTTTKTNTKSKTKSMEIKITDKELLDLTYGILRGMSGSPILQDGKMVGAVTHVFVNEPTKGYAIFIENMLEH